MAGAGCAVGSVRPDSEGCRCMRGDRCRIHLAVQEAAAAAEGFDASDMQLLADRAAHAAVTRRLAALQGAPQPQPQPQTPTPPQHLVVTAADMQAALQGFTPAAFWGVTKPAAGSGDGLEGWQDVGGLEEAVAGLQVRPGARGFACMPISRTHNC